MKTLMRTMGIREMNELRGLKMWHGAFPRLARLLIASSEELGRISMAFITKHVN